MSNPIEDKRPDERLGAYLARAREAKSMTVAELATATRLSEKNISLIEAGDWKAFPVQAYLRGYLNSISVKLSLDSKRVLDWYAAENGSKFASLLTDLSDDSQNKPSSAEGEKSSKGKAIVIILIVIGLALVVASKFFKEVTPAQSAPEPVKKTEVVEEESVAETPEMPEGAEAVPADSVNADSTAAEPADASTRSATVAAPAEKPAPVAGKEQGISQAVVDSAVKNSDRPASATIFLSSDSKTEEKAAAAPAGASTKLLLVASGEMRTWVGIKHREDDTAFLKESNLSKAGTRMAYESTDTLYVVVGEPRAISKFYLNGKEVPLPGMKFGRVTKFRVFGGKVIEGAE